MVIMIIPAWIQTAFIKSRMVIKEFVVKVVNRSSFEFRHLLKRLLRTPFSRLPNAELASFDCRIFASVGISSPSFDPRAWLSKIFVSQLPEELERSFSRQNVQLDKARLTNKFIQS